MSSLRGVLKELPYKREAPKAYYHKCSMRNRIEQVLSDNLPTTIWFVYIQSQF